jgi:hypothetical protein
LLLSTHLLPLAQKLIVIIECAIGMKDRDRDGSSGNHNNNNNIHNNVSSNSSGLFSVSSSNSVTSSIKSNLRSSNKSNAKNRTRPMPSNGHTLSYLENLKLLLRCFLHVTRLALKDREISSNYASIQESNNNNNNNTNASSSTQGGSLMTATSSSQLLPSSQAMIRDNSDVAAYFAKIQVILGDFERASFARELNKILEKFIATPHVDVWILSIFLKLALTNPTFQAKLDTLLVQYPNLVLSSYSQIYVDSVFDFLKVSKSIPVRNVLLHNLPVTVKLIKHKNLLGTSC